MVPRVGVGPLPGASAPAEGVDRGASSPGLTGAIGAGAFAEIPEMRGYRPYNPAVGSTNPKRLGVMGGTFDPIHHGHLLTAEEALWQFELDEVVFVPTGRPWMKQDREVSPPEDRYLMVVIAASSNPSFSVSRLEIEREGPTYTVDTLRTLREQYADAVDLFFITGADAMLEILQWKDSQETLSLAHFIAA